MVHSLAQARGQCLSLSSQLTRSSAAVTLLSGTGGAAHALSSPSASAGLDILDADQSPQHKAMHACPSCANFQSHQKLRQAALGQSLTAGALSFGG